MRDEVYWSGSVVLNIFNNAGQDLGRSFPDSAGIMMPPKKYDTMNTEPGRVSPKVGVEYIRLGFMNMAPGNVTATLLGPLSVTNNTTEICVGVSDGINCCAMRLLGSSALGVWVERDRTIPLIVNIKETHVGPVYRRWNMFLFKLDAIRIQMCSPVTVKAVRNIGNNGLYDLLLSCWIKLGIGVKMGWR